MKTEKINLYVKTSDWLARLRFKLDVIMEMIETGKYNNGLTDKNSVMYKFSLSLNLPEPLDAISAEMILDTVQDYFRNRSCESTTVENSVTTLSTPGETKTPSVIVVTELYTAKTLEKKETSKCKKMTNPSAPTAEK